MITIKIGRTSGPCTDEVAEGEFTLAEIETVKDTLAMVNLVAEREQWYIEVDGKHTIPNANLTH